MATIWLRTTSWTTFFSEILVDQRWARRVTVLQPLLPISVLRKLLEVPICVCTTSWNSSFGARCVHLVTYPGSYWVFRLISDESA